VICPRLIAVNLLIDCGEQLSPWFGGCRVDAAAFWNDAAPKAEIGQSVHAIDSDECERIPSTANEGPDFCADDRANWAQEHRSNNGPNLRAYE
jgi:hypothetical protein